MEQNEEIQNDENSRKGHTDENFPWEEWMVIEDSDKEKNRTASRLIEPNDVSSSDTSYSDIDNTSDAEEAREPIRILAEQNHETRSVDSVNCYNDESDGVSVITESDNESQIVNENQNKIVVYGNVPHGTEERNRENISKEVTTCVYLLIACSMVIAIGIGVGSRWNVDNTISKDIDYISIKMENDRLLERMKELSSVREILEEIKTSVTQERILATAELPNPTRDETKQLPLMHFNNHMNRLDSEFNKPDSTVFERLQIFLRTICLILEDIRQSDRIISHQAICQTSSYYAEIANLRTMLNSVNAEMDVSTRLANKRFLDNVEFQITSMSDTLITDLTNTLNKLNLKNEKKLEKIVYKMNDRLCILRNTMPSENKIRQSLETNNTFVEKCDEIVTRKFDADGKKKRRNKKPKMPQPPILGRKNSKIQQSVVVDGSNLKEKNSTTLYEAPRIYRKSNWETRKCYDDNRSSFLLESQDNMNETCSILLAPPPSSAWKSKKEEKFLQRPVLMREAKNNGAIERKKSATESDKPRLKGDRIAKKIFKTQTIKEFKGPRLREPFASYEKIDGDTTRTKLAKKRSRSSSIQLKNKKSDFKYKPERGKKRFGKGTTMELDRTEREEKNIRDNGDWQFSRCSNSLGARASSVRDNEKIQGGENAVTLLTPKASNEIIEKPEVDDIVIAIFLERILSLFGRLMKKLDLAAALPIILADPEILDILSTEEMKIVKKAFNDYNQRSTTIRSGNQSLVNNVESLSAVSSFNESETTSSDTLCSPDDLANSTVYNALQILNGYSAIREKVKATCLNNDITPQSHLFLQHVKYFIEHCVLRIRSTPVEEKFRDDHYRKLWHKNHRAQQDIDGIIIMKWVYAFSHRHEINADNPFIALLTFLDGQRSSHRDIMKTIGSQYEKDYEIVERLNRKCLEDMKSIVDRSERHQITEYKSSEMRQHDVNQYLAISKNKLEILRETNLCLEQEIRSKRFKVSSQLTGLIGKFDAEVGERYRFLEQLVEEYEIGKTRKEKMEEEMKSQLEICNIFLEEIEQKNVAIFKEKLNNFVNNRAARLIQRWWRPILGRLKLKKKKKKKPKKKKK